MTKKPLKQTVNRFSEALIFDPEVKQVDSLVGSVGPEVSVVKAMRGEVSGQMRELLKSGVTTIHVLGHGKPGQVELAGYVLDGDAWESIAADLEAASPSGDASSFDSNNSNPHRADGAPNNEKLEINFWSCETGEGIMGKKYTQRVADLCDAKVNA